MSNFETDNQDKRNMVGPEKLMDKAVNVEEDDLIPEFGENCFVYCEKLALIDEVRELREVLEVLKQTVYEVDHAQRQGREWYTKGSSGLYQQVRLWLDKSFVAIKSIEGES